MVVTHRALPGSVVGGLVVLSLAVSVFVWGTAPPSGHGGALLPGLRPVFGLAYGVIVLAAELALCLAVGRGDAAVWVMVAAAVVDLVFWVAHATGSRFAVGGASALTAAAGAVAMAAAVWSHRARAGPAQRDLFP